MKKTIIALMLFLMICLQGCTQNDPSVTPESTDTTDEIICHDAKYSAEFSSLTDMERFMLSGEKDLEKYDKAPILGTADLNETMNIVRSAERYYIPFSEMFETNDMLYKLSVYPNDYKDFSIWIDENNTEHIELVYHFQEIGTKEPEDSGQYQFNNSAWVLIYINSETNYLGECAQTLKNSQYLYENDTDQNENNIHRLTVKHGVYQIVVETSGLHNAPIDILLDSDMLNPITSFFSEDTETRNTALDKLVSALENAQINTINN